MSALQTRKTKPYWMCIEPIHIWRCIESGLGWDVVGHGLRHMLHSVKLHSAKVYWDVEETKATEVQSQLGVVQNKTIYMKVSSGKAELGYMAISIAGSIAINLRLLLAFKKLFHLLLCFIRNNNNLFCCLSCSSTLSTMCSFAVSCKATNATATSKARAFQTDQSLYNNHMK